MQQIFINLLSRTNLTQLAATVHVCPPSGNGTTGTVIIKCDNSGAGPIWNLLALAVNILATGVGIAVLFGIVYGAFLYTTAASSADQAKRGIGYIRNAIIALFLFAFMWAIINFIIPGGLF